MIYRDSRFVQRRELDPKAHFQLIDNDLDDNEIKMDEFRKKIEARLDYISKVLTGILVTTTTGAIGVAISVVFRG